MDLRELIGKAVVSLDDAARLGRASDVLVDTDRLRVAGLRVSDDAGGYVLPFDQIANIGPDAVTVERGDDIRSAGGSARFASLPGIGDLEQLKVVDETGTYQGTVKAIHADPTSGELRSVDLEKGGVLGLGGERDAMPVGAIRSVGADVVTVRSNELRGEAAGDRRVGSEQHRD